MLYCLNPACASPDNPDDNTICQGCGAILAESSVNFIFRTHYNVVKLLGQGAFGRTYLAQDTDLMRELRVIKKFIAQVQGSALKKAVELFEREAKRLYELQHPQIPRLYAYFEQDNSLYLVEEYIRGEDLSKEFARDGRFSEAKILEFLRELLPVLDYLHQHKILHRDIKPENIMRRQASTTQPSLVLIDFGGAKEVTETVQNQQGTSLYTPGYAAIEHIMGKPKPASDIYSLGVTAVRLLTGCFLGYDEYGNTVDEIYNEDNQQWIWREILQQQGRDIDGALGQILAKMLEPLVINRYQSAREVLEDLNNLDTTPKIPLTTPLPPPETVVSSPPSSPVSSSPVWSRQKFLKWAGYGGLSLITTVGASFLWRKLHIVDNSHETFSFETVTVNEYGEIVSRKENEAEYITLDLGNGVTMDMVYIPGGTFRMGAPANELGSEDSERPLRRVEILPFYMGKYPVTQAQWQEIMGFNPAYFPGDNRPIERVSWNKCVEFCDKLSQKLEENVRLPSEAEWEYACRAGTTTPFNFGATISSDLANYNTLYPYQQQEASASREETTEVGIFPPNAFGLYDMHGNVWEWCADSWFDNYDNAPLDGNPRVSANPEYKVLRGGSWYNAATRSRSAARGYDNSANEDFYNVGFRILTYSHH